MKNRLLTFLYLVLLFTYFITIIYAENNVIKPEIALIEEQTFSSVGPLNPEFVLYNNGFVIYGKHYDGYFCTMLTKEEKDMFVKSLKTDKLISLKDNYEITACSDCPVYHLYLWNQNPTKKISAYGSLDNSWIPPQGPRDLINALKALSSYKAKPIRAWIPEKIEVRIAGFQKTNKHMAWPKKWPALKSPEWSKNKYDVYTKYFDRKELHLLKEIEKKQQDEIAILFDGELLGVNYRFPFPEENIWISDIRKYDINYYSDEINKRAKEMEAESLKKNIPVPADKFFYYHKAAKELKKKLGLKYEVQ